MNPSIDDSTAVRSPDTETNAVLQALGSVNMTRTIAAPWQSAVKIKCAVPQMTSHSTACHGQRWCLCHLRTPSFNRLSRGRMMRRTEEMWVLDGFGNRFDFGNSADIGPKRGFVLPPSLLGVNATRFQCVKYRIIFHYKQVHTAVDAVHRSSNWRCQDGAIKESNLRSGLHRGDWTKLF